MEIIMKTYSKSNHRRCSIKKVSLNISRNLQENTCVKASFLLKLHEAFIEKETLAQVFFCEFCDIFKNPFLTENLRVTASDLRMQVVVICNLNLSLIFVTINFAFSFLWVFTLAHPSKSPELLHGYVFQ